MIYADSVPIGRAYFNGWLAEIYMGGTLVWSGYKKVGGEAAEIAVSATPTPGVAAGVGAAAGENLSARTKAAGGSAQGEGSDAGQGLVLRLPIVPGERVALAGGKAGQSLVLYLPIAPGGVAGLLDGAAARSVELAVPDVPGQSAILERQNAGAQVTFSDSAAAGACNASGGAAETGLETDANAAAGQCGAVGADAAPGLAYSAEAAASAAGAEGGEVAPVLQESSSAQGTPFTGESGTAEEGMALRVQSHGDKWEPPIVSEHLLQIDWVYSTSTQTSQVLGKILEVE